MMPVFPLGEDSRRTGRTFEGKGDSQPRIQEFLEKACSLVRDHQGNRLTPHLMRSYPWGLPIHATIVIHYFLRRIRACCMDTQPASSLWIVPDFCEIWEFLPYNVGLHVIEFPTWTQPSPTRLSSVSLTLLFRTNFFAIKTRCKPTKACTASVSCLPWLRQQGRWGGNTYNVVIVFPFLDGMHEVKRGLSEFRIWKPSG